MSQLCLSYELIMSQLFNKNVRVFDSHSVYNCALH